MLQRVTLQWQQITTADGKIMFGIEERGRR